MGLLVLLRPKIKTASSNLDSVAGLLLFVFERSGFSTEALVPALPLCWLPSVLPQRPRRQWYLEELSEISRAFCGDWEFLFHLQVPGPPQVSLLVENRAV